jgi:hypothetical protein
MAVMKVDFDNALVKQMVASTYAENSGPIVKQDGQY